MQEAGTSSASLVGRAAGGVVLAAFGAAMLIIGWDYPVGQVYNMGPGFVPMAIGIMICLSAAAILWIDISDNGLEAGAGVQWRGLIFVSAAILIFAGLIEVAGLLPSIFLAVLVSKLADKRNGILGILIYAGLTTLGGWLLFLVILELPIPAIWR